MLDHTTSIYLDLFGITPLIFLENKHVKHPFVALETPTMKLKSGDWLRTRGVHVVRPISGFLQTHRYKAKIGISMYKFTTPLWLSPISWKLTLKIVGCHEIHMFFSFNILSHPILIQPPKNNPMKNQHLAALSASQLCRSAGRAAEQNSWGPPGKRSKRSRQWLKREWSWAIRMGLSRFIKQNWGWTVGLGWVSKF